MSRVRDLLQHGAMGADPSGMVAVTQIDTSVTGPTMRRARELAGLDLGGGARSVGVRRSELRSIERGRRPVRLDVLERAVEAYGDDGVALPPRQDLVHPSDPTLLVVGDETVRIDPLRSGNDGLLADYVAAVRRQRGLGPADDVPFRSHDMVQLARVLDLSAGDLESQLERVAGLEPDSARSSTRTLVLTGLCLAVAGARPDQERSDDAAWLIRGAGGSRPVALRAARLDELEHLIAELRSAP